MDDDTKQLLESAKIAGKSLLTLEEKEINKILLAIAKETELKTHYILSENQKDLQRMDPSDPKYDRLKLTEQRISEIVEGFVKIADLSSPIGNIIDEKHLENGLHIVKKTVPFGAIGIIFEARPNVCFDVFALCFKSKNSCVLKGSSDARFSNEAIVEIIRETLDKHDVNPNVCTLFPSDRKHLPDLLTATKYIDLIIPRGSKALINYVRENSLIPIIETGAGVCHTYFHKEGDKEKARAIIHNAKTRRVSVCNALDCLIIDKNRLDDLYYICNDLENENVTLFADKQAFEYLKKRYPNHLLKETNGETFGSEFLDYKMAIKTVQNINEAIDHISEYGSQHSEAIISEDVDAQILFQTLVDAACIYTNTSTAFTDGAQFGLGAEIGISTQKMHARGPMGLNEICSYKWIIESDGLTRM